MSSRFFKKGDKAKSMQRRNDVCMASCIDARSGYGSLLMRWAACSGEAYTDGYNIQQESFPQEQGKSGKEIVTAKGYDVQSSGNSRSYGQFFAFLYPACWASASVVNAMTELGFIPV